MFQTFYADAPVDFLLQYYVAIQNRKVLTLVLMMLMMKMMLLLMMMLMMIGCTEGNLPVPLYCSLASPCPSLLCHAVSWYVCSSAGFAAGWGEDPPATAVSARWQAIVTQREAAAFG